MTGTNIRYSRQQGLDGIGPQGQDRLAAARVLLMGAGGLGTPAALYLAAAGVGRLCIADFDKVDETNLPRQILYRDEDINRPKALVAAERLAMVNPHIQVTGVDARMDREALAGQIAAVDMVLDCTDNFASRWLINAACAAGKKALVTGAAIRTEGQLSLFRHDTGTGPCYRCLYTEADESLNNCAGQGILGPVAGMIGCMMATEALKYLVGIPSGLEGKLWIYDARTGNSRSLKIPVRADCPVCNPGQARNP